MVTTPHNVAPSPARSCTLVANFTAEPMRAPLAAWFRELKWDLQIEFAPYDQVMQWLLAQPEGAGDPAYGLILIQLERWLPADGTAWRQRLDEFVPVLAAAAQTRSGRLLLLLCPTGLAARGRSDLEAAEQHLLQALKEVPAVDVLGSRELEEYYPVANPALLFDAYTEKLAQIPYSRLGFASLATLAARGLYRQEMKTRKVIVVDCDHTLWTGLCSEEGPMKVGIDAARQAFHAFLRRQREGGRLICLCSKNDEEDVLNVFAQHPGMTLRRDDLVAWKINWQPKSENLRALSAELSLGLDSFVFIDDDAFECGEMRSVCPEVLTIQVPHDSAAILPLLRNVWDLDFPRITAVDRQRHQHYQDNVIREQARKATPSLAEFLRSLALVVEVKSVTTTCLPRAAQLLERTNQFNLNGVRRSAAELARLLETDTHLCLMVRARDRFGDYGEVGLLVCSLAAPRARVETFVLSCRALGKGMEFQIMDQLREMLVPAGSVEVAFDYRPTGKNHAAKGFLQHLAVTEPEFSIACDRLRPMS